MAKKKLAKSQAATFRVPQTRDEVVAAITAIGNDQRDLTRIEAAMNDEIATVKTRYELRAGPLKKHLQQMLGSVQIWCEAHRDELTQGGKVKTHAFASGEVRWRISPPAVAPIRKPDEVIKRLLELGLNRFVRTKEEINKEAILLEPDAVKDVPGIKIDQAEDFIVVPVEMKLDEVAA